MKVAVVGHIEWGKFVRVPAVPKQGEIIHTELTWEEVAGGGSVAAMQLALLAEECLFFTAIGNDETGRRAVCQLKKLGVEVYASVIDENPTKDIFVYIDGQKERTITVSGNLKPDGNDNNLPWEKLADADAVYFVSGNQAALTAARQAKVLVSTARVLPLLKKSGIQLDALVCSKNDVGEAYENGELEPKPTIVVTTVGMEGGMVDSGLQYTAEIAQSSYIKSSTF